MQRISEFIRPKKTWESLVAQRLQEFSMILYMKNRLSYVLYFVK